MYIKYYLEKNNENEFFDDHKYKDLFSFYRSDYFNDLKI